MCECGNCDWCRGINSIDDVAIELHHLLNAITALPPNHPKKAALWTATQSVCDIVTGG